MTRTQALQMMAHRCRACLRTISWLHTTSWHEKEVCRPLQAVEACDKSWNAHLRCARECKEWVVQSMLQACFRGAMHGRQRRGGRGEAAEPASLVLKSSSTARVWCTPNLSERRCGGSCARWRSGSGQGIIVTVTHTHTSSTRSYTAGSFRAT